MNVKISSVFPEGGIEKLSTMEKLFLRKKMKFHLSFPYSFCLTLFSFVLPAYRELDLPVSGPRGGQCHHRYGRRRVVACQLYGQLHRHPHLVLGGRHLLYRRHARRHDGRLHRQVRLKNSFRFEEQGCGFVRFGGSAPDIPLFWRLRVVGAGRGGGS